MSYTPTNEFYAEVAKGNIVGHSIISKFGSNNGVPNGSFELVSTLSAVYAGFLAAGTTVRIKSGGNAADTVAGTGARTVTIEGLDATTFLRRTETINTAGASASSSTSASFARVDRAFVADCGDYAAPYNVGDIVIENTAGTIDLVDIEATHGQSLHCHAAIPTGFDAFLLGFELTADASKAADFKLLTRAAINDVSVPVTSQRIKRFWDGVLGSVVRELEAPVLLTQGPADIWIEARGGGAGTEVSAAMKILLVAQ